MIEQFESILTALIQPNQDEKAAFLGPVGQLDDRPADDAAMARALSAAFLITLAGSNHPAFDRANTLLAQMADSPQ